MCRFDHETHRRNSLEERLPRVHAEHVIDSGTVPAKDEMVTELTAIHQRRREDEVSDVPGPAHMPEEEGVRPVEALAFQSTTQWARAAGPREREHRGDAPTGGVEDQMDVQGRSRATAWGQPLARCARWGVERNARRTAGLEVEALE